MPKSSSPALIGIICTILGGGAGFVAGRLSNAPDAADPTLPDTPSSKSLSAEEANTRVLALEKDATSCATRSAP